MGLALWGVYVAECLLPPHQGFLRVGLGEWTNLCEAGTLEGPQRRGRSLCAWEHSGTCACMLGENLSRCVLFLGHLKCSCLGFCRFY